MEEGENLEKAIIGSLLLDDREVDWVVEKLNESDFEDSELCDIFTAIKELRKRGRAIDVVLVAHELEKEKYIREIDVNDLYEMANNSSPKNIHHYVEELLLLGERDET